MQASTWICTYQMQSIKFMSLLLLLVCFSLSKNFTPLLHFCSLLIMYILSHPLCHHISKDNYISFPTSPSLSSITIKRYAAFDTKGGTRGRWSIHESSIFLWTPLYVGMTPLVTNTCGSMKTTLRSHMYVTCRVLDLDAM
jgi:hypothetical protein